MKTFVVPALILSLAASPVLAAAPLAPGKPAGVHQAQVSESGRTMIIIAGVALAGIGIGLAASSGGGGSAAAPINPPSTSTGGTTP